MKEIITTSEEVAKKLAQAAHNIRKNIEHHLYLEEERSSVNKLFLNFKKILTTDLTLEKFADIYAQTISYGLFILKIYQLKESKIEKILEATNPILKNYLDMVFLQNKDQRLHMDMSIPGIDSLIQILEEVDIDTLFLNFNSKSRSKDLIIHFYENFLKFYDPHQKIDRGVFYTPDAVVSFIVRSIDRILNKEFGCKHGLIDDSYISLDRIKPPQILILDPATGTGTFLYHIIDLIYTLYKEKEKSNELFLQEWNTYVENSLLPRLIGFELLIIPYIIANLTLGLKLKETGYDLRDQRLGVYLTNTLEQAHENRSANEIKMDSPISIVMGNPPYSGHSINNSKWIDELLRGKNEDKTRKVNYFEIDGESLGEKNPKWLNDDYVKFIRFGQWRIEKTGYGILAFITNHSFIDNPTFRGMRRELIKTFTDIYILDLHGNLRRKEKCPDESKDENVFDIQQGVCVSFFIKNPKKMGETGIFKADLWGSRKFKYEFLETNDFTTIKWKPVQSHRPWYMFYQLNTKRWSEYGSWWAIPDIFRQSSVGIMTGYDNLTIQDDPLKVQRVIEDFIELPEADLKIKYKLSNDKRQWTYQKARLDLKRCGLNKKLKKAVLERKIRKKIVHILYRPFDRRYTFFTGTSRGFLERPRGKVMQHMITGKNLGLIISRNSRPASWRDIQITEDIIDLGVMASRPGNNAPLFPLFLYEPLKNGFKKVVNFSDDFIEFIEEYNGKTKLAEEDIIYYIYAILHSNQYRERYEEFLKIDFPKVPFPSKPTLFIELKTIGKCLVDLHLMKLESLREFKVKLKGSKDLPEVKRVHFTRDNRLMINNEYYFEDIPSEVYNFYIGGYHVCRKWLRYRKGKVLSKEDIQYFSKIVKVIQETIILMERIDNIISQFQGWPNAFI
ncbi:MAG: type ISP restriction/modification enzyme [Candidatus Thorarchaeota archaeon]